MTNVWQASEEVFALVEKLKKQYHSPRLDQANIAVSFVESKPFIKDRLNFGKTTKIRKSEKIYQNKQYDFLITLCSAMWTEILDHTQREALIDLHLSCCQVEYEPEYAVPEGALSEEQKEKIKKKILKDKWGRVIYTNIPKFDDEGQPKWRVLGLDIHVLQDNVMRFGCWCEPLAEFADAIVNKEAVA
jgi:hypothetical protein